jgi:hypothetical protein
MLSVCVSSPTEQTDQFMKLGMNVNANGGIPNFVFVLSNFRQLIITTWRACELVRWEKHLK